MRSYLVPLLLLTMRAEMTQRPEPCARGERVRVVTVPLSRPATID